jgi:hypothetical protein
MNVFQRYTKPGKDGTSKAGLSTTAGIQSSKTAGERGLLRRNLYRMKSLACLTLLTLLTYAVTAQPYPRDLLARRYTPEFVRANLVSRATWNPFPATSEAWKNRLPDSVRRALVRAGEEALAKEIPAITASLTLEYVRSGDRDRYQAASFGRRTQTMALVLAESVEGRGRFLDAILNGVWAICEESYWGVPAHLGSQKAGNGLPDVADRTVDLFAAETAAMLALADYFVGEKLEKLSKLVRPRIRYEVNERIFKPLQTPERYGHLSRTRPVNNWNPWIVSNWMTALLLLEDDEPRRAAELHRAMTLLDPYLNSLGDDGGCDEGPSYWFAAGACVFDALEVLYSASNGKIQLYDEPLIRNMASYVYKTHIDGTYFVNFADAGPKLVPDGRMLYRFGKAIGDETLTAFGRWAIRTTPAQSAHIANFHRTRQLYNLLTVPAAGPARPAAVRDAYLADIQVLVARADKGLFLATHGGHNAESHNHNDVGDFILYADGQPVLVDVGSGTYTAKTFSPRRYELWYTQSNYHNLPLINGQGQRAGRAFEARNVRHVTNEKEASLTMDLAAAYPKEARVRSWVRTVRLDRRGALDVSDAYALDSAGTLQQAFLTVCAVEVGTPGRVRLETKTGRQLTLTYDPKRWTAAVERVSLEGPDNKKFLDSWDGRPVQRLLFTARNLKPTGRAVWRVE